MNVKSTMVTLAGWLVLSLINPLLNADEPRTLPALKAAREVGQGAVSCEGTYKHHLQGVAFGGGAFYWSFTTSLVKTDLNGKVLKTLPVENHHGDLCYQDGKLFVAVNLGKFNDPKGNADSWVYVYDAHSLAREAKHAVPEAVHGAGGIDVKDGRFFVVGGLPPGIEENYVYEYDQDWRFRRRHVLASGYTLMGIQTATYAGDRWWFGCYGAPKTLLVVDEKWNLKGRYSFDTSLGLIGLADGRFLAAEGKTTEDKRHTGRLVPVTTDEQAGLRKGPTP